MPSEQQVVPYSKVTHDYGYTFKHLSNRIFVVLQEISIIIFGHHLNNDKLVIINRNINGLNNIVPNDKYLFRNSI